MVVTDKHVLFLRGVLSNWYRCRIIVGSDEIESELGLKPHIEGSLEFFYSEHLFMYLKALLFDDLEHAKLIYDAKTPAEAKGYGRQVVGFKESVWRNLREEIMYFSVRKKFWQCVEFNRTVMNPEFSGKSFVECNPRDRIWGVGLDEDDPMADDESEWKGLNLLGRILTEIRDNFGIEKIITLT